MNRNQFLDVARGLLAWAVVWVHIAWVSGIQGETQHIIGVMAVEGFIILSGFVITQLILTKREKYRTFIFRRFMRLAPAFLVCLALALLIRPLTVGAIPGPVQVEIEQSENHFYWQHLLVHLTMLHGLIPSGVMPWASYTFLPPAWSISLEFQLYLVAPLLIWWLSRRGFYGALLIFTLGTFCFIGPVAHQINSIWPGGLILQRFVFFLAGSLLYLFNSQGPFKTQIYQYPLRLVRLGQKSYSTYLVHYPILALATHFIPAHWPLALKLGVIIPLAVPAILLASDLLYRYVELPGIELGKRLSRRRLREKPLTVSMETKAPAVRGVTFAELPIRDSFQFRWGWPQVLTKSGPFTYLDSGGKEHQVWLLERSVLPFTNYEKTETIPEPKKGGPLDVAGLPIRNLKLYPAALLMKLDLAAIASEIWFWCAFAGACVILALETLGLRGL